MPSLCLCQCCLGSWEIREYISTRTLKIAHASSSGLKEFLTHIIIQEFASSILPSLRQLSSSLFRFQDVSLAMLEGIYCKCACFESKPAIKLLDTNTTLWKMSFYQMDPGHSQLEIIRITVLVHRNMNEKISGEPNFTVMQTRRWTEVKYDAATKRVVEENGTWTFPHKRRPALPGLCQTAQVASVLPKYSVTNNTLFKLQRRKKKTRPKLTAYWQLLSGHWSGPLGSWFPSSSCGSVEPADAGHTKSSGSGYYASS